MHIVCELWLSKRQIGLTVGSIGAFFIPKRKWSLGYSHEYHYLGIGPFLLTQITKRQKSIEPFSWG